MRQLKMSSEPRVRRKCTRIVGRRRGNKSRAKRKKHRNMASGPGWCSKLWIGVNGEALIGIELLCFA